MNKIFNLKQFRRKAFYEGGKGYFQGETIAKQICYKCKADKGKSPQEAWGECSDEYNKVDDKGKWVTEYSTYHSDTKNIHDAKTPAAQELLKK